MRLGDPSKCPRHLVRAFLGSDGGMFVDVWAFLHTCILHALGVKDIWTFAQKQFMGELNQVQKMRHNTTRFPVP